MLNLNLVPTNNKKFLINFWKEIRSSVLNMRMRTQDILDKKEELFTPEVLVKLVETKRTIYTDMFVPSNTNSYYIHVDRPTIKQHYNFLIKIQENILSLFESIKDKDFVAFLLLGGFDSKITKDSSIKDLYGGDFLNNKDDVLRSYLAKFDYANFDLFKENVVINFLPTLDAEVELWEGRLDSLAQSIMDSVCYEDLLLALIKICIQKTKLIFENNTKNFSNIINAMPSNKDDEDKKKQNLIEQSGKEIYQALENFDFGSSMIDITFVGDRKRNSFAIYEKFFEILREKENKND